MTHGPCVQNLAPTAGRRVGGAIAAENHTAARLGDGYDHGPVGNWAGNSAGKGDCADANQEERSLPAVQEFDSPRGGLGPIGRMPALATAGRWRTGPGRSRRRPKRVQGAEPSSWRSPVEANSGLSSGVESNLDFGPRPASIADRSAVIGRKCLRHRDDRECRCVAPERADPPSPVKRSGCCRAATATCFLLISAFMAATASGDGIGAFFDRVLEIAFVDADAKVSTSCSRPPAPFRNARSRVLRLNRRDRVSQQLQRAPELGLGSSKSAASAGSDC